MAEYFDRVVDVPVSVPLARFIDKIFDVSVVLQVQVPRVSWRKNTRRATQSLSSLSCFRVRLPLPGRFSAVLTSPVSWFVVDGSS